MTRRRGTAQRIVDLATSGDATARRQDFYLAAAGKDTFAPGVAFALDGQLLIGFDRSSSSTGPSIFVVRQRPADALGSVSAAVTLITATGFYRQPNGAEIVGVAPDPLIPDSVWVANVKGTATASEADPDYELKTAQARMFGGATYATITPAARARYPEAIGLTNGSSPARPARSRSPASAPSRPTPSR